MHRSPMKNSLARIVGVEGEFAAKPVDLNENN
jgi:hypothetical protein